jgi:hypothetical protein
LSVTDISTPSVRDLPQTLRLDTGAVKLTRRGIENVSLHPGHFPLLLEILKNVDEFDRRLSP